MDSQLFNPGPGTFEHNLWEMGAALSSDNLITLAQNHQHEPYFGLQILLRHCEGSPLALIEKYATYVTSAQVQRSLRTEGAGVVRATSRKGDLSALMACLPGDLPGVWLLCTPSKSGSAEYDSLLSPLLENLSTRIKPGWVSSRELEKELLSFQAVTGTSLSPSRVASRGFDRSTISYLRAATLDQVIAELRESKLLMHSLSFTLNRKGTTQAILSGSVNRSLRLVYRGGSLRLMHDHLIRGLEQLLATHFGSVAVVEREWGHRKIAYRFEQDNAIMSRESHVRLVEALATTPQLSVCAFHLNPYLNLSVTDLSDGSSMALMSDLPDRVFVLPGRQCSAGAVSRVLDTVYAKFAAGHVSRADDTEDDWSVALKRARA